MKRMIKKISILIIIVLLTNVTTSCDQQQYVLYQPHYKAPTGEKHLGEAQLSKTELLNTIQVLKYYNEDFRINHDQTILISKQLNDDWEMVWNYTNKAKDKAWLSTHIPEE